MWKKMGNDFLLFRVSVLYYRLVKGFYLYFDMNNCCLLKF